MDGPKKHGRHMEAMGCKGTGGAGTTGAGEGLLEESAVSGGQAPPAQPVLLTGVVRVHRWAKSDEQPGGILRGMERHPGAFLGIGEAIIDQSVKKRSCHGARTRTHKIGGPGGGPHARLEPGAHSPGVPSPIATMIFPVPSSPPPNGWGSTAAVGRWRRCARCGRAPHPGPPCPGQSPGQCGPE